MRALGFLLASTLLLAVAGCGGSDKETTKDASAGDTAQDSVQADQVADQTPGEDKVADKDEGSDAQPDTVTPPLPLRVGVARTAITPEFEPYTDTNGNNHWDEGEPFEDLNDNDQYDSLYVGGFGLRTPTGVHDDLWASSIAIEVKGELFILTSLDLLGLSMKRVNAIKSAVEKQIPAGHNWSSERMVIASTHTHQGPDTMGVFGPNSGPGWDEGYLSFVVETSIANALEAVENLQPATLWVTSASDTLELIRDIDPPEIFDPYVGILQARDMEGKVLATLLSIANHPEACWGDNTLISSDYVHFLREATEKEIGGQTMFFAGALGLMQTPATIGEPGFERAEYVGQTYAQKVLEALENAEQIDLATVTSKPEYFKVKVVLENPELYIGVAGDIAEGYSDYLYREEEPPCDMFGCLDLPIFIWRLGDQLTLLTFPGELTPELIVGGIVTPPDYEGDFPDAPAEPHVLDHVKTKYRFIIGLADSATGYYYPKMTFDPGVTYGQHHGAGPNAAMTMMTAVVEKLQSINALFE